MISVAGSLSRGRGMLLDNKTGNQDDFAETVSGVPPVSLCGLASRFIELVSGAACLALLAPILLLTAIAIKLDSAGPIFVREARYGYKNRTIRVWKFRAAPASPQGGQKAPRLILLGRLLRRTGIEELPMLINVIRGEMSIIGPPPSTNPTASLNERKPGITRWSEIFTSQKAPD
jgi:lipopolysaccharide/colanic/teichoic acid biosynthesis glycosyltransferase